MKQMTIALILLSFQGCRINDQKEAEGQGVQELMLEDSLISADDYNALKRAEALKTDSLKKAKNLRSKNTSGKGAGAWYEGGTLHRSKISDWKKSTDENKLATCADFIAKIKIASNKNELPVKSTELRSCINEATRGLESTNNETAADVAALCVVTLGYQ